MATMRMKAGDIIKWKSLDFPPTKWSQPQHPNLGPRATLLGQAWKTIRFSSPWMANSWHLIMKTLKAISILSSRWPAVVLFSKLTLVKRSLPTAIGPISPKLLVLFSSRISYFQLNYFSIHQISVLKQWKGRLPKRLASHSTRSFTLSHTFSYFSPSASQPSSPDWRNGSLVWLHIFMVHQRCAVSH